MTATQTTNEAADRLRRNLSRIGPHAAADLDAALAAERRNFMAEIRERLHSELGAAWPQGDPSIVDRILDEVESSRG